MTTYDVTVVDYRTSNLLSIVKAFQRVGATVELTQSSSRIDNASRLVLPGVGAFGAAMRNIDSLGIRNSLIEYGKRGKPLIGVCLGMQLLFNVSFERGVNDGLGLLSGEIVAIDSNVKVPHIGWNRVEIVKSSKLFDGIPDRQFGYFVHSYYAKAEREAVIGETEYGSKFPSVVQKENVFGIQFHPEKSQNFGLKILENFLRV